ncbi:MAG: [acyl-carrier-protein] S-malonyltransferase [Gammaproteobacteria bacterium GWE2_42_36]|nr:MAG: [acyl-carrier-protein] S-malonyltransferase [Gammaproteobacteria bacterium GWE2_42_36]HCU04937.1 [acyl-carrier-protein] S-malonyltransferase [Coxiellaceae bacterium]
MNSQSIACVFPGQGSQEVGMLADVFTQFSVASDLFKRASVVLGEDLLSLVQKGPAEQLNQTIYTQPIMLAADMALWQIWLLNRYPKPQCMAGHSLGEYAALVAAEAIDFEDAIRLVRTRAELMQNAVPAGQGATAVILSLTVDAIRAICDDVTQKTGLLVSAVNFNSPEQTVIAGEKAAVEEAMLAAKQAGAKRAMLLPVSIPVHCKMMQGIADDFTQALNQIAIRTPKIAVINNVDVQINTHPDEIRAALVRQIYHPVRWIETIECMKAQGITHIVECGPKAVLSGLIKRIDKEIIVFNLNSVDNSIKLADLLK